MNALGLVPAWAWRWAALAAVLLAAFVAGWVKGNQHGTEKLTDYQAEQATASAKLIVRQGKVTQRVVERYIAVAAAQALADEQIHRGVEEYAENTIPSSCLDADWRRLHDAAAAGALPGTPGRADDPAGAPTAAAALETVTDNYSACQRTAQRLEGLQNWVTEQRKLQ